MKYFLISILFFGVMACKVQPKPTVLPTAQLEKPKVKGKTPIILAINGKYMFEDSTAIRVFMDIEFDDTANQMSFEQLKDIFVVQWSILQESGAKEKLKSGRFELNQDYFKQNPKSSQLSFVIPKLVGLENTILVVEFIDKIKAVKYTNEMLVDMTASKVNTRFNIFDKQSDSFPSFTTYLVKNQVFVIKSLRNSTEKTYLIHYKNNSLPALSPMSSSKRDVYSEFQGLDTLTITPGTEIKLQNEGLYVLTQNLKKHTDGFSFLVVDERFPRSTQAQSLKESLVYLSTQKEIEALREASSPKEALDMYFLNLTKGNQDEAKQIIKNFYARVALANKNFSNYKEGWKTDKGMVFIVMGPPNKVQRNRKREVWVYAQNKNSSEIIYTFYQKPNDFSDQTYELVRYPEYSSYWYPYVEAWRTGKVEY